MSHNSDRLFVPGSTTKVLTMVTALEALGEVVSAVWESMRYQDVASSIDTV